MAQPHLYTMSISLVLKFFIPYSCLFCGKYTITTFETALYRGRVNPSLYSICRTFHSRKDREYCANPSRQSWSKTPNQIYPKYTSRYT